MIGKTATKFRLIILTVFLFSILALSAFGALFVNNAKGPFQVVINGTQGVGSGTNNHLIYLDTNLKILNDTVTFFVTGNAQDFTNVTLWLNRSATFNQTSAYCSTCTSNANFTGQAIFNISLKTNVLADGNYSLNISGLDGNSDQYYNLTWYNQTAGDNGLISLTVKNASFIIIDNTAPTVSFLENNDDATRDFKSPGAFNISVRLTEPHPSVITFRIGNSTYSAFTTWYTIDSGVNLSANFTGLADGNYTYNVTVNDTVGHKTVTATRSIILDTVNPVATMTAPSSATTTTLGVAETMTCAQTDANPGNVTMTRSDKSGDQCTGTSSCTATFTSDSYTSPTFTCAAVDKAGHTNSKTFSFTRIDPPATGSSSGGSSGGGSSGGASSSSTSALGTVAAETSTTTTLNTAEVKEVTFTTTTKVDNAKVSVDTYTTKPASVPDAPEGTVFSYFEVNTVGFSNTDLKKSSIKFAVTQQWLSDNKLTPADVVLAVYRDGAWKVLPTSHANGDETSEYFVAETEGFSTFAILAQQKAAETTTTTEEQAASEAAAAATQKKSLTWLVALLVVVALVVIFFVVKKRNK